VQEPVHDCVRLLVSVDVNVHVSVQLGVEVYAFVIVMEVVRV